MVIRQAGKRIADIVKHVERDGVAKVDEWDASDLRMASEHLDPTDDDLATDAGTYAATVMGVASDPDQVRLLVGRAQHIIETRVCDRLPRDWVIAGFIAGRLGADWAKEKA